jgi:hypothetical protein
MKNLRQDRSDSLRPEYTCSDFGEMAQGKYATTQLQFYELAQLLLTCIGEDEGLTFTHHSSGNHLAGHNSGQWTYELDNANQITLRFWLNEIANIEEPISNPVSVTNPQERSELQNLLVSHVRALKTRVKEL